MHNQSFYTLKANDQDSCIEQGGAPHKGGHLTP